MKPFGINPITNINSFSDFYLPLRTRIFRSLVEPGVHFCPRAITITQDRLNFKFGMEVAPIIDVKKSCSISNL